MNNFTRVIAASLAAGAIAGAFGMASAAQFTTNGGGHAGSSHGSSDSVSKADFFRLQGQVTELERRVSALEHGGGGHDGGRGSGKGHAAGDSWQGH